MILHRLGHDQVAAGAQDPAHLGQHRRRIGQVVQDVERPDQAHRPRPEREVFGVARRHRGLEARLGGARRVVLDADGREPGPGHAPQPVAPSAAQVEHHPRARAQPGQAVLHPRIGHPRVVPGRAPPTAGTGRDRRRWRQGHVLTTGHGSTSHEWGCAVGPWRRRGRRWPAPRSLLPPPATAAGEGCHPRTPPASWWLRVQRAPRPAPRPTPNLGPAARTRWCPRRPRHGGRTDRPGHWRHPTPG